jgi:hypothetical protein
MVPIKKLLLEDALTDPYAFSVVNLATTASLEPAKHYLVHYQRVLALHAAPRNNS